MKATHTLVVVAVLVALLWRIEVELRGWQSLGWITYFHFAVPLGGAIFVIWLERVSKHASFPGLLLYLVIIWGSISVFTLEPLLTTYFSRRGTMLFSMSLPELSTKAVALLVTVFFWTLWQGYIVVLYTGYRKLFYFRKSIWLIGCGLWGLSWFLGLILITILPERGYHDLIHALKTGWMIPFCVFATGLPIAVTADQK